MQVQCQTQLKGLAKEIAHAEKNLMIGQKTLDEKQAIVDSITQRLNETQRRLEVRKKAIPILARTSMVFIKILRSHYSLNAFRYLPARVITLSPKHSPPYISFSIWSRPSASPIRMARQQ